MHYPSKDEITQKYRETPKLIYKKSKTSEKLLNLSSWEITSFVKANKNQTFPHLNSLLKSHLQKTCKKYNWKFSKRELFGLSTNILTNEFHQITFFLNNIGDIPKDQINFSFEDIEEIWWSDNPDFIVKVKNKSSTILLHIELTRFDFKNTNHKIKLNADKHLRQSKIDNSTLSKIKIKNFDKKIYVILFTAWNKDDKKFIE